MSVRLHHGSFLARWRDENGEQQYKSFPIEPDARQFEKKMRREVQAKRRELRADPAARVGKVGDLCDLWAEDKKYWYDQQVALHLKVKAGDRRLHELNAFLLNGLFDYWKGKGLARNTQWLFGSALKRLLKWFETLPGCPRDLSKQLRRIPSHQPRTEMLTVEEERKLLDGAAGTPWLDCWLHIFFCLGLRMAEVCALAPCHYNREQKVISNLRAKGGMFRIMAVPTELQNIFDRVQAPADCRTPYIELLKGGGPLKFSNIRWHFRQLKKRTGVPMHKRPHDMRATAITTFHVNNGCDLIATQRFAGHKYIGSTQLYVRHLDDHAMAPLIEKARILRFDSLQAARIAAQKRVG